MEGGFWLPGEVGSAIKALAKKRQKTKYTPEK